MNAKQMKAMIFAAGLGTRLQPLTLHRPKALVTVGGATLLEIAIRRLRHFGCRQLVINVHHFAEQILEFLHENQNFGIDIAISDERALLLDTGGGLKQAMPLLQGDGPFIVYNTDILTTLDLGSFYQQHLRQGALATLAVRQRPSSRQLLFNAQDQLSGWRNTSTGEERRCRPDTPVQGLAFSGIHVIDPRIADYFPDEAVFSIIDTYLHAGALAPIHARRHDADEWLDVGRIAALPQAEAMLARVLL